MKKLVIIFIVLCTVHLVQAQPHFRFAETDVSHSLLIESAIYYGEPLSDGNEIGVFTPGGVCAGAVVWHRQSIELLAWRDDARTQEVEGFQNDEAFSFRYWDIQAEEEIAAEAHFTRWDELFRAHGHSRLELTAGQNRAPELSHIGDQQVSEGSELSFDLAASDPDEDQLTFSAEGLPEGASLDGSHFAWTPSFYQARDYNVTFTVSDGNLTDSEMITINVSDVNGAPELAEIGDKHVAENNELSFDLSASDPDDDALTFSVDDLPEGASIDGSHFSWTPSYDQSGNTSVTFIVTDNSEHNLTDSETISIAVINTNRQPEFSPIDDQQIPEMEELSFDLSASDPDHDELTFRSDNLPTGANLSGSHFSWTPSFDQAGSYESTFTVSDGDLTDEATVTITVNNTNRTPEWTLVPREEVIVGYVDQELQVEFTAFDPDSDDVEYTYEYLNDPEGEPEAGIVMVGDRARFTMQPDRFEYGEYDVLFTASDGEVSIETHAMFDVRVDHFRFEETGRVHTIRIDEIKFAFGDQDNMPDPLDEIAVLTPDGLIAGAYRFNDEDDAPWSLIAWGDLQHVQGIQGFRNNEAFRFRYWDHSAGEEYDVSASLIAGSVTWRLEGFSVFNLFIGPELALNLEEIDFGYLRTGTQLQRVVRVSSTGSTPAEGVSATVEGASFSASPAGPFDIAVGQSLDITVTFTPNNHGEFSADLTIGNDLTSVQVDLKGFGIEQNHFTYPVTNIKKTIRVLQADLDGEALSEGDEIGVLTPDDQFAGSVVVHNEEAWDIYAWGDDPTTRESDGFRADEAIRFKIWDPASDREVPAFATYFDGDEHWTDGGFAAISLTTRTGHFYPTATDLRHHIVVNTVDFFNGELSNGDEIAVVTYRNTVAGATTVEGEAPWEFDAYGDNLQTPAVFEGFAEGTLLYFRLWDHNQAREVYAEANIVEGPDRFEDGGRTVVELTASANDNPPVWRQVQNQSIDESQQLEFDVAAVDQDNNPARLSLVGANLPPEARFTDNGDGTGHFVWMPNYQQAGVYLTRFTAFDGWTRVDLDVRITVNDANQPPVLEYIGDRSVDENQQLSIMLEASDLDGDRLTYRGQNIPFGASLVDNLFRWTPNNDQAGEYDNVRFEVIDVGHPPLSDFEVITITVSNVNIRPVWEDTDPVTRDEGQRISVSLNASDADGDDIELSAGDLPGNSSFENIGNGRGTFNWQTNFVSAGEYTPYFVAFDGNLGDTLRLLIIVNNVNRQPVLTPIGNQQVRIGQELDVRLTASDPDPGEGAELRFYSENLPPHASIENTGPGEAHLVWRPTYRETGSYNNVRIDVDDPSGGHDYEQVRMTAIFEDNEPPVIANVVPANGAVVRSNQPTISANITDELTIVDAIEFTFDNRRMQDFSFVVDNGEFSWTPGQPIGEGAHSFRIRALDQANNRLDVTVRFTVNSTAGEIVMDEAPIYTNRRRIHITGIAEPFLSIQLYNNDELVHEVGANGRGIFRVTWLPLSELWNHIRVEGHDAAGNIATPAELSIYVDLAPPTVEIASPGVLTNDPTPEISVLVEDLGVGVDAENGIDISLDGMIVEGYQFQDGLLSYMVPEALSEGEHLLTINAVDLLGNAPDAAIDNPFFVDSRAPVLDDINQNLFDEQADTISNQNPVFSIPMHDPQPASGTVWDDIVWTLDGEELSYVVDEINGSITHDFAGEEPLAEGHHDLRVLITDIAGNRFEDDGEFVIADIPDDDSPFFGNLNPPDDGIVGDGIRPDGNGRRAPANAFVADTLTVVIGDNDAGVDVESVEIRINGQLIGGRFIQFIPPGRFDVPLWVARNEDGGRQIPIEMPGIEEGINFANAFGGDNEGNVGEMEWNFYYDGSQPGAPSLNAPEHEFVDVSEITVTGRSGSDEAYDDGYENQATIRIYRNDELVAEQEAEFESDYSVSGVLLVAGQNTIKATTVDAGQNESEYSDPIVIFLDRAEPVIEDFMTVGGPFIATSTPTLTATLLDEDSGIDPEAISLNVDNQEIEVAFDEESNVVTGVVRDAIADGEHSAVLVIHDRSGNEMTAEYSFDVDTRAVSPPEFTLQPFTSENQIVLSGSGVRGQYANIYLNDELIEIISLPDSAEFNFISTRDDLPDTSYVTMSGQNEAGVESAPSEPQRLIKDSLPPGFSNFSPDNGSSVEANQLQEIFFTLTDTVTGVDLNNFELTMQGEALQYSTEEIEFGYRVFADVSNYRFGIDEQVVMNGVANDHSIPPNQRSRSWNFVTTVGEPPNVNFPDTTFAEDGEFQLYVFNYITDPDNGGIDPRVTPELLQGAENANVSVNDNGFLTITPAENFFGELILRIHAQDASGLEDADTSIVTVTPVNDYPVIHQIDNAIAIIGHEFTLQVEASDIDPGDTITFTDDLDLFTISPGGLIDFTPSEDMRGLYNVKVYASDQAGGRDSSGFQLLVTWINREIEIVGEMSDVEIDEDSPPIMLANLDEIFSDPDGQELRYSVEFSDNGAGLNIDIDSETHIPLMTPNTDFSGDVNVTITADDYAGSRVSIDFGIHVVSVNDAPRLGGILPQRLAVNEDAGRLVIVDLDSVFYDVEEDAINYSAEGADELGIQISQDNILSIQSAEDWYGIGVITLTVGDRDEQRRVTRRVQDGEADIASTSASNFGLISSYLPVRDDFLTTEITVNVRPVNDAPRRQVNDPCVIDMNEDQDPLALPITVGEMFTDVDQGDQIVVAWENLNGPIALSYDLNHTNIIATLTQENWFDDEYDYPVTATDQLGAQTQLVLRFVVTPVNDRPTVSRAIADQTRAEDADPWLIADLDEIFEDPDGDQLHFEVAGAENLIFSIDEENRLTCQPQPDYHGESIASITASDGNGEMRIRNVQVVSAGLSAKSAQSKRTLRSVSLQPALARDEAVNLEFQITITPVNDEPVWVEYPHQIIMAAGGDRITFAVEAQDVDADNLNITASMEGLPEQAVFDETGNGTGQFTWQTNAETSGQFEVVLSVSDGNLAAEITVRLSIFAPPVHFVDYEQTGASHSLLITGVSFDGEAVQAGWEIGVFTPGGALCGSARWNNDHVGAAVWGADDAHQDYFQAGQTMLFKLWDPTADAEWSARAVVEEGSLVWQANGYTVLAVEAFSAKTLEVAFRIGWNLTSINVTPTDQALYNGDPGPEIIPMMAQLRRPNNGAHHLLLMKNERGLFYVPERGFNGIPYWHIDEGYQVRMDTAMSAFWTGTPIDPHADIPITRGWNMIAYFPDYQLAASRASQNYVVSPIIDHVIIAKDGLGNFMIPSRGFFSNMPPWREGQGYQINVDQDVVLNYPQAQNQAAALSVDPESVKGRWADVPSTGANMSVLVTKVSGVDLSTSDQVAAFSPSGLMVGVGRVIDGQIGIAVWGDDASTQAVDGLKDGEAFTLKLWNAAEDVVVDLSSRVIEGDRLVYLTDGFTVIDASVTTALPTEFYLSQNYPNPFNAVTRVAFGLPEASRVTVRVFDLSGREVSTLVSGELQAGHHSVVLDGESMVSGVYIVKMEATNFSAVRKVMLVK